MNVFRKLLLLSFTIGNSFSSLTSKTLVGIESYMAGKSNSFVPPVFLKTMLYMFAHLSEDCKKTLMMNILQSSEDEFRKLLTDKDLQQLFDLLAKPETEKPAEHVYFAFDTNFMSKRYEVKDETEFGSVLHFETRYEEPKSSLSEVVAEIRERSHQILSIENAASYISESVINFWISFSAGFESLNKSFYRVEYSFSDKTLKHGFRPNSPLPSKKVVVGNASLDAFFLRSLGKKRELFYSFVFYPLGTSFSQTVLLHTLFNGVTSAKDIAGLSRSDFPKERYLPFLSNREVLPLDPFVLAGLNGNCSDPNYKVFDKFNNTPGLKSILSIQK